MKILIFLIHYLLFITYIYGQGSENTLNFIGTTQGINIGNQVANNCRTIEMWFKPTNNVTSSFNHIETLTGRDYGNGNASSIDEFFLGFYSSTWPGGNGGKLAFIRRVGTTVFTIFSDNNSWSADHWYHVAVTMDNSGMKMYINGVLQQDTDASNNPIGLQSASAYDDTYLAAWGYIYSRHFQGAIDEVRFWTTARTQTQIRDKMCSKLVGNEPGLKAYYRFDTGSGNTLFDNSTNSYDGTLVNMNNSNWVYSGAPIGNVSTYIYNNLSVTGQTLTLNTGVGDELSINNINTTSKGVHIYKVNSIPNSTTNLTSPSTGNYYGVFLTDISGTFNLSYDFSAYSCSGCNEIFSRNDNAVMSWTNISGLSTLSSCIYSSINQSTVGYDYRGEYIIDVIGSTLSLNLGNDTILCPGTSLTLDATTPNVTYLWQNSSTNSTLNATTTGTYWVQISDGCGSFTDTINISYSTPLSVNLGNDTILCPGASITLDATTSNVTYSWQNGSTNATFTVTSSGMYWVQISDNCGTYTDTVNVTYSTSPIVDLGNDTTLCNFLGFALDAGNIGNSYLWNNSTTNQTLNPTAMGVYSVTVTNSDGCSSADSITISQGSLNCNVNITNTTCNGDSDGEIDITVLNGVSPYTYSWSNLQTTEDINSLTAGNYTVTIVDNLGCQVVSTYTVSEPAQITINAVVSDLLCYQDSTGAINIIVSGGNGGNTYQWNNTETTEDISNLDIGSYSVTVVDVNNCTANNSFTVTQPYLLQSSITPTNILCYNDNNGSANLTVSGGTQAYTYLWSNGQISQDATNLSGQTYTVTITDANNCTIVDSVTITGVGTPLVATVNNTALLCYGDANASVQVIANGATPPYNYNWSSGQTSTSVTGLNAGDYFVTVTDSNNCQIVVPVTIAQPAQIVVSLPSDFYMCKNPSETISASTTGGTPPYSYSWNNGGASSSITISPSTETNYIVTVTDVNGCETGNSIIVKIYPPLQILALADKDTVCPGDAVIIDANYSGGTGIPYQFFIDGQPTIIPHDIYPTQAQTFTITIKDKCDKTADDTYTFYNYPMPEVSFNSNIVDGCQPLQVHFNNYSNCVNCSYAWDFDIKDGISISHDKNPVHTFYNEGVYDITCIAINQYNCKNSQTLPNMISVYPRPIAKFIANPKVTSIIKPTINFTSYSEKAYYYYWFFGDGDTSNVENPHHRYNKIGYYNVELIATSIHRCKDTIRYTIIIQDEFTLYVPTGFSPDGDGINDGFKVFGNGIDKDNFLLIVYDRWGEPIWQSTDINKEWNGKAKNSNDYVPNGTYIWKVICKDFYGENHQKTGRVNILR